MTQAQKEWPTILPALVSALNALPDPWDLAVDSGDLTAPASVTRTDVVDDAWFNSLLGGLVNTAHLRMRRTVDPLEVTVADARDLILALRNDIDSLGDAFWALMRTVGFIEA